jgi:hypothetical protein
MEWVPRESAQVRKAVVSAMQGFTAVWITRKSA